MLTINYYYYYYYYYSYLSEDSVHDLLLFHT